MNISAGKLKLLQAGNAVRIEGKTYTMKRDGALLREALAKSNLAEAEAKGEKKASGKLKEENAALTRRVAELEAEVASLKGSDPAKADADAKAKAEADAKKGNTNP